jgi:hypothetical protein
MKWLILLALSLTSALASDISGTWKGVAETDFGKMERTFVFKVEGAKLTGTTTHNMFGESTIQDGRIEGDTLTFWISVKIQDNDTKLTYKGKVEGETIRLTAEIAGGEGRTIVYVAKRAS